MVNGIGSSGGARNAIQAAIQRQAEARRRLESTDLGLSSQTSETVNKGGFSETFKASAMEINSQLQTSEKVIEGVLKGEITEFHEVAAQIKQADLGFKFALAVRNKFIDAYREVMRMSV